LLKRVARPAEFELLQFKDTFCFHIDFRYLSLLT
jgi:hypothetical protein